MAEYLDKSGTQNLINEIKSRLGNKVDKADGMGLSQNSFTNAEKSALAEMVDSGSKNLLKITSTSSTITDANFTVNNDGTVTVTATNTAGSRFFNLTDYLPIDTYIGMILSGSPSGSSAATYRLSAAVYDANRQYIYEIFDYQSDHAVIYKSENAKPAYIRFVITVFSGQTFTNLVFRPMLCTADKYAISPDFKPYVPTNAELYEMIKSLQEG